MTSEEQEKKRRERLEYELDLAKKINKENREYLKTLDDQFQTATSITEQLEIQGEINNQEQKLLQDRIKLLEAARDLKRDQNSLSAELNKKIQKSIDRANELLETMQKQKETQKDLVDSVGSFFKLTLGLKKRSETLIGKFETLARKTGKSKEGMTAMQQAMKMVGEEAKEYLNIVSATQSVISKIAQSSLVIAKATDDAVTSFNKLAGTTIDTAGLGEYGSMIHKAQMDNLRFGVTAQEAGAAAEALISSMSGFTEASPYMRKQIMDTVVQLDALGVSSDITAKNMEIATRSLGMTRTQAKDLQMELYNTAAALGLPPAAVAEGFANAAPVLAAHGSNMSRVLKGLAKSSKETGLAISELIDITKEMDTFKGAADAAGKLNAVLGGDLFNSYELLYASEDERIKILQRGLKASGRSWATMDKHTRIAVANAAGITDVSKAAALLNPQMIGLSEAEKTAAERAKSVVTVGQQMEAIFASLAMLIEPVLPFIKSFLDFILEISASTGGFGGIIVSLVVGLVALKLTIALLSFVLAGAAPLLGSFGAGLGAIAGGLTAVGAALTAGAKGFLVLGAMVALAGIGIGVAAAGFSLLAESAAKLAEVGLSAAIAMGGLTVVMAGFFFAMIKLGGLGAAAILGVIAALFMMTTAALAVGASMGMVALSFTTISTALSDINRYGRLASKAMDWMTDTDFGEVAEGYRTIATEIRKIAEYINEIPESKVVAFSNIVTAEPVYGGAAAIPAVSEQASSNASSSGTGRTMRQHTTSTPVILQIDGEKLGEVLIKAGLAGRVQAKINRANNGPASPMSLK